jgi:hypothetical protein
MNRISLWGLCLVTVGSSSEIARLPCARTTGHPPAADRATWLMYAGKVRLVEVIRSPAKATFAHHVPKLLTRGLPTASTVGALRKLLAGRFRIRAVTRTRGEHINGQGLQLFASLLP